MRADRLLSILLLLQTKGRLTAGKLAEMLEVSERTIYRDLDALSAAGIPIYAERGPGGGCILTEGYRTNLTGLTEAEVRSLFMAGVPGPLSDLGLGEVLEDAFLKLLAALPSVRRSDAERVRQRIMLDSAGWFQMEEPVPFLPLLQEALWEDRRIHLIYRKPDHQQSERLVDPYGLVAKTSIWYLVAATGQDMRVYRVSRVISATLTHEQFERPESFDLPTYWKTWCADFENSRTQYPVKIRIAPDAVNSLPLAFGEGIRTQIEQYGSWDMEGWLVLPMTFENMDIACGRLVGFGPLIEVLDPPELREHIIHLAERILAFYHQPTTSR